jgi:hypothetical protein
MIDVRMGKQDEIDGCGIETEWFVVARRRILATLHHTAVDKEAGARGFYQKTGPGNFAGRTQKT